jgi:cholesterol 7alpha-monooxygenase
MGSREVLSESIIGGKRLKEGKKVLMPYRAMHFDSQVFGDDSNNFNPRRFMERKNLIKSPSYRPFGGAAHYCPGRFIARREVQMFVAIVLMRFELEAVGKDGKEPRFPKMDDSLPTGGVQGLVKGEEVLVRVRPSKPDL